MVIADIVAKRKNRTPMNQFKSSLYISWQTVKNLGRRKIFDKNKTEKHIRPILTGGKEGRRPDWEDVCQFPKCEEQ